MSIGRRHLIAAMTSAGLLLSLGACSATVRVEGNPDISGGWIGVEVINTERDFDGRIDVHRINEDGSTGDVIGSAAVNSETLSDDEFITVQLDLSRATDVLALRLYDKAGQNRTGIRVNVTGAGSTLDSEEATIAPTSAPISPSPSPSPKAEEAEVDLTYTGPIEYNDPLEDCHQFNRDPADCPLGIDMEGVLAGLARDEAELDGFLNAALEKGYGIGEVEFTEPMVIFAVKINGFDPAAGNLCVIFASPQENLTPPVAGANVVQTCTFPDGLTYTTRISTNGERTTEFGEAGPIGVSDQKTTITILQPLGSIFRENPLRPFSIHMNNNEGNVLDDSPVENLLRYLAAPLESVP